MTPVEQHGIFGKPRTTPGTPHTVIIAHGDRVRHFTIRPLALALTTALASAIVAGGVGTAAFFLMQGGRPMAGAVHSERLQNDYEDRIASLRAQLDRVVSRQLLDQVTVETKVKLLIDQQLELTERYEKLSPLLDRARSNGLILAAVPIPRAKPVGDAAAPGATSRRPALGFAPQPALPALDRFALVETPAAGSPEAPAALPDGAAPFVLDKTDRSPAPDSASRKGWRMIGTAAPSPSPAWTAISPDLIREIGRSISSVEERQLADVSGLASSALMRAAGIASALRSEGIRIPDAAEEEATALTGAQGSGGPFVPVPDDDVFDASFAALDAALDELQAVRHAALQLPLGAPVADAPVSSTFGVRADPFLGRSALHTGIDFVATTGTRVAVATAGTVVVAGPSGGYGTMVEVDHGGGITTRYGHLSAVLVTVGDRLQAGDAVGMVGSTGRSTGPHLHYEIRRDGNAIDPARFLRAGRKIEALS